MRLRQAAHRNRNLLADRGHRRPVAPRRPRAHLTLLLLAALLLAAAPAAAQAACDVVTAVNPARLAHEPGQALRYNFSVLVPQGSQGGDVAIVVEGATPGWAATVAPATFDGLTAGQNRTAEVLVTAPPEGNPGAQAQVTITATLTCQATAGLPLPLVPPTPPATATESQVLSPILAAPVAPARPAEDGNGLTILLLGIGIIVLAATGAAVALRPKGLVVRVPEPSRDIPPGGGASFGLQVENRGREGVEAAVRILGLPAGWKVISPPADLRLAPGATSTLRILLRSPPDAAPGDAADVRVELLERGSGRLRHVDLHGRVQGPATERPEVVVRDERTL